MINNYLHLNQLKAVFGFLFQGKNITVLRFLRHAGRSKVCWIYFCRGDRLRATFVSFKELLQAYYRWLSTVNFLRLRLDESKAIGRANFSLLNIGDTVFHVTRSNNQMGVVVEKTVGVEQAEPSSVFLPTRRVEKYLPTVWVDWGNGLPIPEMPWLLESF